MEQFGIDIEQLQQVLTTQGVEIGFKLLAAIATFIVGRIIVGVVMRIARTVAGRVKLDPLLERFLLNILNVLLTLFVIIATLGALGFDVTSVIAVLGAAGLAVGLALQGSLSNFASGVLIVFFKPYRVGDFIEAGGESGSVETVTIFNTILVTPDNRRVIVPNANVTSGSIVNYSTHETRRIDLVIGVGYDDNLPAAKRVLEECIADDPRLLKEPAPQVAVSELGASSVDFVVRPWVKTGDYWPARFDLTQRIKEKLDAAGISIPYPQRDLHVYKHDDDDD